MAADRRRSKRRTNWLAGSEWNWAPLYKEIVDTIVAGDFAGSEFNDNYRVGYKTGTNPFVQSKYGKGVSADTKALVEQKLQEISTTGSPFAGPVKTQSGDTMFAAGVVPAYAATAWYHGKLDKRLQAKPLRALLDEVEAFAEGEYNTALFLGDKLPPARRTEIIRKLTQYPGLSAEYLSLIHISEPTRPY